MLLLIVPCFSKERELGDEYGWKQIHGDVFRPATHRLLFTALIGTGYHILTVLLTTITFAIVGELYTESVVPLFSRIFYIAICLVSAMFVSLSVQLPFKYCFVVYRYCRAEFWSKFFDISKCTIYLVILTFSHPTKAFVAPPGA